MVTPVSNGVVVRRFVGGSRGGVGVILDRKGVGESQWIGGSGGGRIGLGGIGV